MLWKTCTYIPGMEPYCEELNFLMFCNPIQKRVYLQDDLLRLFEKGRQKFIDDSVNAIYRAVLTGVHDGKDRIVIPLLARDQATMDDIRDKVLGFLPSVVINVTSTEVVVRPELPTSHA